MNFHVVEKRIPINYEFPRRKSSIILQLALVMSKYLDDLYSSFPHHYYFFVAMIIRTKQTESN
jgi:hypothetical protein